MIPFSRYVCTAPVQWVQEGEREGLEGRVGGKEIKTDGRLNRGAEASRLGEREELEGRVGEKETTECNMQMP